MNPKSIATIALLVFVAASVLFIAMKSGDKEPLAPENKAEVTPSSVSAAKLEPAKDASVEPSSVAQEEAANEGENEREGAEAKPATAAANSEGHIVKVYYFHTTRRCYSCNKIEELTKEAIESGFTDEISKGIVVFNPVNTDVPENKRFIKDFNLVSKSVVVTDIVNGEQKDFKILEEVWFLLRDKEAFKKYVVAEIQNYLRKKS